MSFKHIGLKKNMPLDFTNDMFDESL